MFKKGGTDGATFRQLQDAFNYNTLPPPQYLSMLRNNQMAKLMGSWKAKIGWQCWLFHDQKILTFIFNWPKFACMFQGLNGILQLVMGPMNIDKENISQLVFIWQLW